ncbi:MAG: hypothetical protein FJ029_04490, partial [Actinobacteria bacterium]|nr:hypothetical protein [Actinomycetota bacterium]
EFAYLASAASAWVINTVTFEEYLAGIAEQSGDIPWEALRASVVAYRTYGYAVRAIRRARALAFDAAASTHNTPTFYTRHQVYHGYAFERGSPRVAEAAAATRGMVMTYGGEPIQSVYFSRAHGRTRSWHEEWGGPPKPWAMGVPDPYSVGRTLLGHGIGMPLQSCIAMGRAGANAELILRSYYSDVLFEFVY